MELKKKKAMAALAMLAVAGTIKAETKLWIPPPPPQVVAEMQVSRGIALREFARIVLEEHEKVQFVLSPELLQDNAEVGISSKLKKGESIGLLNETLKRRGYEMTKTGGVYFVDKAVAITKEKEAEEFVRGAYTPKNRSVDFFAEALPPVFDKAQFNFVKENEEVVNIKVNPSSL